MADELLYTFVLPPVKPRGAERLEHPAVDLAIHSGGAAELLSYVPQFRGQLLDRWIDEDVKNLELELWGDSGLPDDVYHFQFAERVSYLTAIVSGKYERPLVTMAVFTTPAVMVADRETQVRPTLSFGLGPDLFVDFMRHLRSVQ